MQSNSFCCVFQRLNTKNRSIYGHYLRSSTELFSIQKRIGWILINQKHWRRNTRETQYYYALLGRPQNAIDIKQFPCLTRIWITEKNIFWNKSDGRPPTIDVIGCGNRDSPIFKTGMWLKKLRDLGWSRPKKIFFARGEGKLFFRFNLRHVVLLLTRITSADRDFLDLGNHREAVKMESLDEWRHTFIAFWGGKKYSRCKVLKTL